VSSPRRVQSKHQKQNRFPRPARMLQGVLGSHPKLTLRRSARARRGSHWCTPRSLILESAKLEAASSAGAALDPRQRCGRQRRLRDWHRVVHATLRRRRNGRHVLGIGLPDGRKFAALVWSRLICVRRRVWITHLAKTPL